MDNQTTVTFKDVWLSGAVTVPANQPYPVTITQREVYQSGVRTGIGAVVCVELAIVLLVGAWMLWRAQHG